MKSNCTLPAVPPLPQEAGTANAATLYDPFREKGIAERPQTLRYSEIKINFPLKMARAHAEAIIIVPPAKNSRTYFFRWLSQPLEVVAC